MNEIEKEDMVVWSACSCSSGEPELVRSVVQVTKDEYNNGDHYEMAEVLLMDDGYEGNFKHFDQNELGTIIAAAKEIDPSLTKPSVTLVTIEGLGDHALIINNRIIATCDPEFDDGLSEIAENMSKALGVALKEKQLPHHDSGWTWSSFDAELGVIRDEEEDRPSLS